MSLELSYSDRGAAVESDAAVLTLSPEFPKPGGTLKVRVNLPGPAAKPGTRFVLSVREFDGGKTVLTSEFTSRVREGLCAEVLLRLPADMELGYYTLTLRGPRKQELASEGLMVVDSSSLQTFDLADAALRCMVDAAAARGQNNPHRAILLLERAAGFYERAESPQCAGLALASAAEVATTIGPDPESFERLGWKAVQFLLVAGDAEGASDVTRTLVDVATSIPDAVGLYVESARAALEAESAATGIEERRQTILSVAANSLPQSGEDDLLGKILAAMRASQKNQYLTGIDELIYLATNEIAVYERGVLFKGRCGPTLHCTTFVSKLEELSGDYATPGAAAAAGGGP